jgi:hypothetical protein
MIDEEMLSKIIGVSVGTYPKDIEEMLVRNNVLATAPQYTTEPTQKLFNCRLYYWSIVKGSYSRQIQDSYPKIKSY